MAVEAKRACGYRKVGGLYLVSGGLGVSCCKMPIILHVCPTCNGGVKQSMGWQWIDPRPWIKGECSANYPPMTGCPIGSRLETLGERVGLLWVGTQFYPKPETFAEEARTMGISKRIKAVPRGFEIGKHWVFLAHPKVKQVTDAEGKASWQPGVFHIFKPSKLEKIVTQSQADDVEEMEKLAKAGITPVVVPDDDRDHQGSVYDREPEAGVSQQPTML